MSFSLEQTTVMLHRQPVRAIAIASRARQPIEDGYPVSGDMLATFARGTQRQIRARRGVSTKGGRR